jgi:hypothetical protein
LVQQVSEILDASEKKQQANVCRLEKLVKTDYLLVQQLNSSMRQKNPIFIFSGVF